MRNRAHSLRDISWKRTSVSYWREAPDPTRAAFLWCSASKSQDWHRTIQTVTKAGLTSGLQCSGTFPRNPQKEEQHCGCQCISVHLLQKSEFQPFLKWTYFCSRGLCKVSEQVRSSLTERMSALCQARSGWQNRKAERVRGEERDSHSGRRLLSRAGQENLLCVCDGCSNVPERTLHTIFKTLSIFIMSCSWEKPCVFLQRVLFNRLPESSYR